MSATAVIQPLALKGLSNKQIAEATGIPHKTVECTVRRLRTKGIEIPYHRSGRPSSNGRGASNNGAPAPGEMNVYVYSEVDRDRARRAAKKRGVSLQQVVQMVVDAVCRDNLFEAVLDDGAAR